MKKIVFLSFFMIMCVASFAQLKHFFPDSNACFSAGSYKFWIEGDTTINSLKYKKVYIQMYDSVADFSNAGYYAALREDTLAEKVYLIEEQEDCVERLIYDFSLEEGDTARVYSFSPYMICNYEDGLLPVVERVDSIFIGDSYRKRLVFNTESNPFYYNARWFELWWIEGIGSTNGPFTPLEICCADCEYVWPLLCIHIDDELVYQPYSEVEGLDGCYLYWSIGNVKENESKCINIYPNPSSGKFNISAECNEGRADIYDSLGRKVTSIENITDGAEIDLSGHGKGVFMVVFYVDGRSYERKVIVE